MKVRTSMRETVGALQARRNLFHLLSASFLKILGVVVDCISLVQQRLVDGRFWSRAESSRGPVNRAADSLWLLHCFLDGTIQPVVSLQEAHSSVWMLHTWSTLGSLATPIEQRKACFMKTLRAHHHPVSSVQGCSGEDQDKCGTVKLQVLVCD